MKVMTLIILLTLITFTMTMKRDRLGKQTTLLNVEASFNQNAKQETQNEKHNHKIKRNNGNGMRMNGKKFQRQGAFIPPGQYKHMLNQQQQQQPQMIFLQPTPINNMQLQSQLQQQSSLFQPQLQQQGYFVANQAPMGRQVQVQPQVIVVETRHQIQPQLQLQPQPLQRPPFSNQNHVNIIQQQPQQQQQQQQQQDTVILIKQLPSSHAQQVYQVQTLGHQRQQQQQQQPQLLQQFQSQPTFPTLPINIQQNDIAVTAAPQNRFKVANEQHSIEKYEQQHLIAQITETIKNDQNVAASAISNKQNQNDVEILKDPKQLQKSHQAIITEPTTTTTTTRTTPNPRLYDLLYGSNLNNDQQQQQRKEENKGNEFGIDPRIK